MNKIEFKSSAIIYNDISDLTSEDAMLMSEAIEARSKAYAPYSNFLVGAALLLEDGQVVTGNNQENAAYPSGMCAERVAVWKASSEHPKKVIIKMAITAASLKKVVDKPIAPCGSCRQTLLEYEINQKKDVEILFMGEIGEIIKVNSLKSLLPFYFEGSFL